MLKICKPSAGLVIASLCAEVSRGSSTPCVFEKMSSLAEASGVVVPIPTPCEKSLLPLSRMIIKKNRDLFRFFMFVEDICYIRHKILKIDY